MFPKCMHVSKRSLRQGMTIFPSAMVNLSFGVVFGWVAPAMEYLRSEESPFEVTEEQLSWIASAYFGTEVISAVFNGIFAKRLGRKPMLVFAAFLQATAWFVQIMATSPAMIIAARALLGVAAGTHDMIWCMYLGEVTSPVERGVYGSLLVSIFLGGVMATFFLSLCVPFAYVSIVGFAISVTAFVTKLFIKETPFYLIKKGKHEAAIRNLAWLQGEDDPQRVQAEFDEMKKFIEDDENKIEGIVNIVRNPSQYTVAIVGVLIFTLAQPSGNIAILSFQTMLMDLYDENKPGADLTVLYGIVQFVGVNLAPFVIEKIGRKKPMIIGFGTTALIHVALTYLFYVGDHENNLPYLSYIICALFNLYGLIFAVTIFPTIYVLKAELFATEIKSLANFSATMTNALVEFVVVKLFMCIWLTFGLYVNFIVYAGICVLSVVYVAVLIPETRGKSLIQIQEKIRRRSQASQQKKISNAAAPMSAINSQIANADNIP